jgi:serine/threonine protein kinase/tetratricopeptide (TPR) repeat protein
VYFEADAMTDNHIQLGPFELDQIIGRGGMGEIWKGVHSAQRVPVAVKVLTEKGARRDDYLRQFRNEIRSVAGLDHPGIVLVFDHGEVDEAAAEASGDILVAGSPYLVMEYARHGALDRYVWGMNWPVVRHIVFNVLDALSHAHARGVVHRDLKPQNILLGCARKDGLGLKLADFGLAHPLDLAGRTGRFEAGWGTPSYMAPEQFRGKFRDYGPPTDLYALGIVVWQLTTGGLPFEGANVMEVSGKHLHGTLPAYEPRFEVPDGLKGWMKRLLQKDHRDRFQTAADAAYAFAQVVGTPHLDRHQEESGRILAGQHAPTVPIRASDDGTLQFIGELGIQAVNPDADTIHEQGATTLLLEEFQAPATSKTHTVTFDVAAWMEQPFVHRDDEKRETRTSETVELAEVEPAPLPASWRQSDAGEPSPQLLGAGLGLFGLRTVRMVDRTEQRDWLWETLAEVHRHHEARLVLLQGRTGTGKSRLAQWVCERAAEVGGGVVLSAFHSPISGPADGLSGMIARHFGCVGLERRDVEHRLERELRASGATEPYEWRALTELISPSVDGRSDDNQSSGSQPSGSQPSEKSVRFTSNRQRYALLRRMVERIARERPVILWLDDVQWGADALGLAEHLLDIQRSTRSPIFMVLTARTEALNTRPLERSITKRLLRSEHSEIRTLRPLEKKDTSELVRRLLMLEGDLAEQVEARSDGNPLFAVQLVDDWVSTGKLSVGKAGFCLSEGQTASIPDNIHQLWGDRIKQLVASTSESARVALELAAALGQEVERDEWLLGCKLAGVSPQPDLEDALLRRALARSIDGGWRFVHGMLRESLERLSREDSRWNELNSVCADVLEQVYGTERARQQRRAHYLLEAGRREDAISPLLDAARFHAGRSDFGQAHQRLDERADLLADIGTEESAAEWGAGWVLRSEIYELEGNYTQALTWAKMAVKHARGHAWLGLLSPSLRAAGSAHLNLGDFERARECFDEARELGRERDDGYELALSLLGLGRVAQARGDFETARALLEEAAELLVKYDDEQGLARCYNALGDIARQTRELSEAQRFAELARELFDGAGNQVGVADCLSDLSELSHLQGEVDRAEQLCASAIHLYETAGSLQSMRVRLNLAFILLHRGDFDEARSVLARSRDHFEREAQLAELAYCDVLLLACAASNEDWAIWDELIEEAERLAEKTGLRAPRIARAATIAAEVAEEHGDSGRATTAKTLSERFTG